VKSGRPLAESLVDLEASARDGRLRNAVPQMREALQGGGSLSGAMARYPELFPAHVIASVWSGELAGKLDIMIDEVASDFESEASDTRVARFGWGLTKISLVFLIASAPFYNMGTVLAPAVSETDLNVPQTPAGYLTHWVSTAGPQMLKTTLPIALALVVSWIAWGYIKRVPVVRLALDRALLFVPAWGPLHRYRSVSRFLHVLEELYAAGINPSTAWDAASTTPRNNDIAERLRLARGQMGSAGVAQMAAAAGVLEPDDLALINTGEKTGQVPATLSKLAEIYADKAAAQKTTCRMWSVSLATAAQLAISGAAVILMASTYRDVLVKLMGF
jgi:type II secretory pathway component PulF